MSLPRPKRLTSNLRSCGDRTTFGGRVGLSDSHPRRRSLAGGLDGGFLGDLPMAGIGRPGTVGASAAQVRHDGALHMCNPWLPEASAGALHLSDKDFPEFGPFTRSSSRARPYPSARSSC